MKILKQKLSSFQVVR